jgi:type III restriction enzyme
LVRAERSLFNFVSCDRSLEESFALFADLADDVAAFAKNTGPQALRIDYEGSNNRHAYYTPDFFVRLTSGKNFLVETKGEMEQEVGAKAKAAKMWCQSASQNGLVWEYLFVPEDVYTRFNDTSVQRLADACAPELARLLHDAGRLQAALPFYEIPEAEKLSNRQLFIRDEDFEALPADYRKKITQASDLFNFLAGKNQSFSPCFQPLMSSIDHASISLILALLKPEVPTEKSAQDHYFMPDTSFLVQRDIDWLKRNAVGLKKALVYASYTMPISMLSFCLEYARLDPPLHVEGIFKAIQEKFNRFNKSQLFDRVEQIRIFRNNQVAHSTNEDTIDEETAKVELKNWVTGLAAIHKVRNNL